jgi:glycine dehydrogenase
MMRTEGASRTGIMAKSLHDYKFCPAAGRVDNVYGDRNLVCSCAEVERELAE